jgi:hypothetical protein
MKTSEGESVSIIINCLASSKFCNYEQFSISAIVIAIIINNFQDFGYLNNFFFSGRICICWLLLRCEQLEMASRVPRTVRLLGEHGMAALMPTMKNGKYWAPMVSKRKAAVLRKNAIADGSFGAFDPVTGGWDSAWDVPKSFHFLKPFKGHLRERTRPTRAAVITKAMAGMPDRVNKLREEISARKPKKDFSFMLKRIAGLSKPLSQKPTGYVKKDKKVVLKKKK